MISIDYGMDCESPETVSRRQLCQELEEAQQLRLKAERRAKAAEITAAELKTVNRKQHEQLMQFIWTNLDMQDINDGLKAEIERLKAELEGLADGA